MGSHYDTITVVTGAVRVPADRVPTLLFHRRGRRLHPGTTRPSRQPDAAAAAADRTGQFVIHTVNGFGGYDPSSPPARTRRSTEDGCRFSVGAWRWGSRARCQCGDIGIAAWGPPG